MPPANELDWETLDLGRRATYRRVLAILRATDVPFVVAGRLGLSLQIGRLIDGPLEVYTRSDGAERALAALSASGYRVERDEFAARATIGMGDHAVILAWGLPAPLGGDVDAHWFESSSRRTFLDLRVRVAPVEELLWLYLALPAKPAPGAVDSLFLLHGESLDWNRLMVRLAGLEALLLSHLFAYWQQHPEEARRTIPEKVLEVLQARLRAQPTSSLPVEH